MGSEMCIRDSFSSCPIDAFAGLDHAFALVHETRDGAVDVETVRHVSQSPADRLQFIHRQTGFTATRIGAGGVPGQPRPAGVAKMVCDFDPHGFDGLGRGDAVLHVSASQGLVDNTSVYPVAGEDYWRAIFDIDFSALPENNDDPIDIAAYVEVRGKAMTETLLLQLFPSQLRRIVGTRA